MYDLALTDTPPSPAFVFSTIRSQAHVTRDEMTNIFRDLLDRAADISRPVSMGVPSDPADELRALARRRRLHALAILNEIRAGDAGHPASPARPLPKIWLSAPIANETTH